MVVVVVSVKEKKGNDRGILKRATRVHSYDTPLEKVRMHPRGSVKRLIGAITRPCH